ncbi:hypothetical protein PPL_06477 [Heterostelium album PN500]|uniref:Uncharacterized protein n=1 Tax=Heterostelium pallidum (strain ATCC 26659 / Pp 5 / PN500) TaxID=670386 RepID=D3BD96_HETP5|nr:hypothetical protein PPL_06477 [Heterostelium album PN500]EFA80540.1 hypothetical protein PPL_06477 [Heterostelium album PN500]|eukprot:XP_020432660.1 hypothetical protein PPL_06477 [Heterostelium album PN500]
MFDSLQNQQQQHQQQQQQQQQQFQQFNNRYDEIKNDALVKVNEFKNIGIPIYIDVPIRSTKPSAEEQSIIDNIEDYLNGSNKRKLVEWYLDYIETNIDRFLISDSAFNFSCIPTMYLDNPPSSMTEIERNLLIVRRFLDDLEFNQQQQKVQQQQEQVNNNNNNKPNQHNTKIYRELVVPVRSVVQSAINKSKSEFDVIIWHCLAPFGVGHRSKSRSSKEFYRLAKAKLEQQPAVIPNAQKLQTIIDDLQHLELMETYDDEFFVMDHSTASPDDPVVGVIGLILNRLHRLENELKTIQHHWNPNKSYINTPPSTIR